MKLCRFELASDPGTPRSGIYHDSRFYETDGENAVGIHDPGAVRILPPIGLPPSVRLFEQARDAQGQPFLTYSFANSTRMQGPNTEIFSGPNAEELDFDVRVVVLTQDSVSQMDPLEAQRVVLGYAIMLSLFDPGEQERLAELGLSDAPARDLPYLIGPFLVTPDELIELRTSPDPLEFGWAVTVQINGDTIYEGSAALPSFGDLLDVAAARGPIVVGEVLASPTLDKPALVSSNLGRGLLSGDRVAVTIEPLGTLVARIA